MKKIDDLKFNEMCARLIKQNKALNNWWTYKPPKRLAGRSVSQFKIMLKKVLKMEVKRAG